MSVSGFAGLSMQCYAVGTCLLSACNVPCRLLDHAPRCACGRGCHCCGCPWFPGQCILYGRDGGGAPCLLSSGFGITSPCWSFRKSTS
jgi:hypothetical protein